MDVRKFFIKLVLLIITIPILQLIITAINPFHAVPEIQELDKMLAQSVDVIYFGDSTLTSVADSDQNKNFTSRMLQEMQPDRQIGRISHPAYHMELFLDYARYVVEQEHLPEVVIIPINLRSFSPAWDMRPEYQFEKEKRFLRNGNNLFVQAFDSPLAIFHWYEPEITKQAFEATTVYDGAKVIGRVKDFEQILAEVPNQSNVENSQRYFYLYELNASHRKVKAMLELADVYRTEGIEVVFYITPIDYQTGSRYLGDHFDEQVAQNVALVTELLEEKDVVLLDFSFSLESEFFSWRLYPDEHLDENGRYWVAQKLSQQLDQ